ncbi:MAG: hypothetical protein JSU66_13465 [Deltaproteobacteria bacterium]|nr:MAG: hypothetical protein JSU66_13465 [Deltaproteobacteria bacterium]
MEPVARRPVSFGPLYLAILLCSAGVLMQEILLTRIFSFTIWYHLAYLTISTALLGFGAAGSILAAFPGLLGADGRRLAAWGSAGAGLALLVAMAVLGPRPLEPHALLHTPGTFFLGLLGYYGAVTVPFLLAGLAVAAPLSAFPERVNRLYAADLLGAGLGCAGAVLALSLLDGAAAVAVCAAVLVAAGAVYAMPSRLAAGLAALALLLGGSAPFAKRVIDFRPTGTKALGFALEQPETRMLFTRWSPVNRVDLYQMADTRASWWGAYGRSPLHPSPAPRSLAIQYDGHNGTNVYQVPNRAALRMLDHHLLRTPYVLREKPRVLVIGVGGGVDVLNALYQGASHVTGLELQPITIELLNGPLAGFTGGWFQRPEVELVAGEGRHFVRAHDDRYDVIQITAVDTFSAQTTGAYVLAESYLYTVEAFEDYLDDLRDGGLVSVVLGSPIYADRELPSPLVSRLLLVARAALERRGVEDPAAHLLVTAQIYPAGKATMGTMLANLIVKDSPFSAEEVAAVERFASQNRFRLELAPGVAGNPSFVELVSADAARLEQQLDEQRFALAPVTDDRPFFYHVLRWRSLLSGEKILWYMPGSTTGLLVLLIMLIQALLLGALLILLPLARGARGRLPSGAMGGFLLYFLALGLGFLLIEISFVQKYVLLLGHPTYSLSVTIFSLLVFAALGAAWSRRFWSDPQRFLATLLAVTLGLVLVEVQILPWVRDQVLAAALPTRIGVTVLLQLPLGLVLGMYFPTGVELVRRHEPRLVPWAWAVNGVASVVATVLAVILGMAIGFSGVTYTAAAIYAVGTLALLAALRRAPAIPAP